jgi:hypothetical protein
MTQNGRQEATVRKARCPCWGLRAAGAGGLRNPTKRPQRALAPGVFIAACWFFACNPSLAMMEFRSTFGAKEEKKVRFWPLTAMV